MADRVFDRDTVLDVAVNIIPLGILLFFIGFTVLIDPFGYEPTGTIVALALLVIPFVLLIVLTYVAGRIIAESERTGTSSTSAAITKFAAGNPPTGEEEEEE